MHFKNNRNDFWFMLFFGAACFIAGMVLETILNLPKYATSFVFIGLCILAYVIYKLRIWLNPLRKIEQKIRKQKYKHQALKIFFDEYIPKTKVTYPKTIYKYISLNDTTEEEKTILNSIFTQTDLENWINSSTKVTNNEHKLFSLATDSLWFTSCSSSTLNDPFEGRHIVYDDDFIKFSETEIAHWKQYAEDIRNNLFVCCFSKKISSPTMWAHYANNYKGYCLEFKVVGTQNLWEVSYSYGKNLPNFEINGLKEDLWTEKITKKDAREYIKLLHKYWATSKYKDWEYENEIRAMFPDLNGDMNIAYDNIGIKLSAIVIGHNCAEEHKHFLTFLADRLSIPVKTTSINTTSINYLDIVNYKN